MISEKPVVKGAEDTLTQVCEGSSKLQWSANNLGKTQNDFSVN